MHNISTGQQQDKYANHAQVWELLPWFINGRLSAEEKQRISEHTAVCLICRKELGLQSALRDAVKSQELDEVMVTASFDRLSAKLHARDAEGSTASQDPSSSPANRIGRFWNVLNIRLRRQFRSGSFATAMLLLVVVIIVPGFTAELLLRNNTFKTLSNAATAPPVAADFRLIFADGIAEAERDAILDRAGLGIVSGPDERGLYFVSADEASAGVLDATLKQLRGNEKILFAEFAIGTAASRQPPGD